MRFAYPAYTPAPAPGRGPRRPDKARQRRIRRPRLTMPEAQACPLGCGWRVCHAWGMPSKRTIPHDRPVAVALEYSGQGAPRVTAKGEGEVAEQILRLARENDIPLRPDRGLVSVLAKMELNQEIPEGLYRAVAEVIAFAYLVKGRRPPSAQPTGGEETSY